MIQLLERFSEDDRNQIERYIKYDLKTYYAINHTYHFGNSTYDVGRLYINLSDVGEELLQEKLETLGLQHLDREEEQPVETQLNRLDEEESLVTPTVKVLTEQRAVRFSGLPAFDSKKIGLDAVDAFNEAKFAKEHAQKLVILNNVFYEFEDTTITGRELLLALYALEQQAIAAKEKQYGNSGFYVGLAIKDIKEVFPIRDSDSTIHSSSSSLWLKFFCKEGLLEPKYEDYNYYSSDRDKVLEYVKFTKLGKDCLQLRKPFFSPSK